MFRGGWIACWDSSKGRRVICRACNVRMVRIIRVDEERPIRLPPLHSESGPPRLNIRHSCGDLLGPITNAPRARFMSFDSPMPIAAPPTRPVSLFGIQIDPVTLSEAVRRVDGWFRTPFHKCHVVVTPNLDHVVRIPRDEGLRRAYEIASLVIADGWPLVTASRWLHRRLPERVAGSDLVPALFTFAQEKGEPISVFLLGAMPGVAAEAGRRIAAQWPAVRIAGYHSPPLGFERDPRESARIMELLDATQPDLLVVGFGCPKQECWLAAHQDRLPCKVAIAAGATIDFLGGRQKRAPKCLQALRLEWAYRLARDPRRLARRYLFDALAFPAIFLRERSKA